MENNSLESLERQVRDFCERCLKIKQQLLLKEEKDSCEVRRLIDTNRAI